MSSGEERPKGKADRKPPRRSSGKPLKAKRTNVRDLEKGLEEALRREAEAVQREAEAHEQQTATSEILRMISQSPTDVQPVFDSIARSAVRLCEGEFCFVLRFDGALLQPGASHGLPPDGVEAFRRTLPRPAGDDTAAGRAIARRAVVQIPDVRTDPEYGISSVVQAVDYRSLAAVPMLRDGVPMGAIVVGRSQVGLFPERQLDLLKTFADQAMIAVQNVRLFTELEARNGEINEALDQQTATSEILKVISASPTDVQPVFDTIVRTGAHLCEAAFGFLARHDGALITVVAHSGATNEEIETVLRVFPMAPTPGSLGGRTILERAVVHIPDIRSDPIYQMPTLREGGWRTGLGVPLLREGAAIGVLGMWRRDVRPFSARQIELLQTFADQAVIAIENVRLFKELEARNRDLTEALEQQTATSEVLKVISQSAFDLQPVLENVVASATRLCAATRGHMFRFDGEFLRFAAAYGAWPEFTDYLKQHPTPVARGSVSGRAAMERRTIHVRDVLEDPDYEMGALVRQQGYRAVLAVPMLREGTLLGVIALLKSEPAPFTDKQIELVTTFADQAVIAIENVRLFTELEASNRELTTALDKQTATSDVLRVISQSQTDVQPVFDAIVASAVRLLEADSGLLTRIAGDQIEIAALTSTDPAGDAILRAAYPLSRHSDRVHARVIRDRAPLNVADAQTDPRLPDVQHATARARGYRSHVAVPLLRHDEALGAIAVTRHAPGGFTDDEIALLQTFADQAVIAIENARLLSELQRRTQELEVASRHKSEFLASMSHELRTPLNAIIGFSEVLTERMFGELTDKQEEYLKDIYASGQHLLSLINDILDLSKIEAGRMELELSDFDLPTALDSAVTLVRERAGRRAIALHMTVDDRLGQVRADERKIRQVVLNLLSNAIKFTPEGGQIAVRAEPRDGSVEISVSDTGVGIAPEDQEAVFEEFRQVGTADKKVEGTGLGLALCRKFVALHGGRIWVKSELGQGSTFTFALPVRRGG